MTGAYTEYSVKKLPDAKSFAGKVGLIAGVLVLLFMGFMFAGTTLGTIGIGGGFGLGFIAIMIWPRFNVEYEYIYCDGQFDFDKISGSDSRKHILRLDLDSSTLLAPESAPELDSVNSIKGLVVKDFSSGDKSARRYCLVATDGESKIKVIFEPSDEILELAKSKAPRKVITGIVG